MYQQVLDPVAHSLAWSSLVAAIPLLVLFILLGMLRVTAWIASLVSLAVSIVIAAAGGSLTCLVALAISAAGLAKIATLRKVMPHSPISDAVCASASGSDSA